MDEFENLLINLYTQEHKWYKLPSEFRKSAKTKGDDGSGAKEMYYTTLDNKEISDYPASDDKNIFIVGRYEWDYYYDEDSYDIREGYFLSIATIMPFNDYLNAEDVYTILDTEIEAIQLLNSQYISIATVFDNAKKQALNISDRINDFLKGK